MSATTERATLTPDPTSDTGAVPVLAVRAGEEVYGFPLSSVREILDRRLPSSLRDRVTPLLR